MKHLKKVVSIAVVFALLLASSVLFTACAKTEDKEPNTGNTGNTSNENNNSGTNKIVMQAILSKSRLSQIKEI